MRRPLLGIVMSILLLAAGPSDGATLGEARALIDRGERASARAVLDGMLAEEDRLPGNLRDEAAILRADLEEDGAAYEARLRELLDRGGSAAREARLRLALGHALFARGEIDLALGQYQKAREKGLLEEGSLWEGMCALALGDPPSAREALGRAASSGNATTRQRALLALGDSYRLAGDPEEAMAWYRRVAEDPAPGPGWSATARLHEAECLRALKRDDEALEILRRLLDSAPGSYDAPAAGALLRSLAPPPPAPEPAVEAAPPPGERFAVQLGAFTSEENAVALAAAARERTLRRVRIVEGSDALHRVVVGSFPDHDGAAAFGDSLGAAIGASATVVSAPGD